MAEKDDNDVISSIVEQMNREKLMKRMVDHVSLPPPNRSNEGTSGNTGLNNFEENIDFSDDDAILQVPRSPPRVGSTDFPSLSTNVEPTHNSRTKAPFMARCIYIKSPDDFYVRPSDQEEKMKSMQSLMNNFCADDLVHPMNMKPKDQIIVYSFTFECWCRAIFEKYAPQPQTLPVVEHILRPK